MDETERNRSKWGPISRKSLKSCEKRRTKSDVAGKLQDRVMEGMNEALLL